MDAQTILLKTPRGREEIRTRAHGLSNLARRLLILADGRKPARELAQELDRPLDDAELQVAFQQLLDEQYLHVAEDVPAKHGLSGLRDGAART